MDSPVKKNLNAAKYNDFSHLFTLSWDISNSNFYGEIRDINQLLIVTFQIIKSGQNILLQIARSMLDITELGNYHYDIKENEHRIIYGDFILRDGVTQLP